MIRGAEIVNRALMEWLTKSTGSLDNLFAEKTGKIVADAQSASPLASIVISSLKTDFGYVIYTEGVVSAYIEFGTGVFAADYVPSLPQDFQELAASFFVSGKGRLPAHPYLYPAFEANTSNIVQDIINVL